MRSVIEVTRDLQRAVDPALSADERRCVATLLGGGEVFMAMQDLLIAAAEERVPLDIKLTGEARGLIAGAFAAGHSDAVEMYAALDRIPAARATA